MLLLAVLLLLAAVPAWRWGGPLLAMLVAWLVCMLPVAGGVIVYDYLQFAGTHYLLLIAASIAAFYLGAVMAIVRSGGTPATIVVAYDWRRDLEEWLPFARVARVLGALAVLFLVFDAISSGRSITNLQELRTEVIQSTEASWLARLASLVTWSCFFCFAFALYFRHLLNRGQLAGYIFASSGVVLTALTSAGRQAVFQIVLLTLIVEALRARRLDASQRPRKGAARGIVVLLGGLYLTFVTMTRTSGAVGYTKSDLFLYFFNAHLRPGFERVLLAMNESLRDVVVEFLIYSTHPVALFSRFTDINFGGHYWGMMDFPFVFRQLEPLIGYRVIDAFDTKSFYLTADKVIGVGWTTGFSSQMMDFGVVGGLVFLAIQGYIGQRANVAVQRGAGFGVLLLLVLAIMAAIYVPYLPLFSDTNMFLLLIVVGGLLIRRNLASDKNHTFGITENPMLWP